MSPYLIIGVARNLCSRGLTSEAPKAPRSRRRKRRGGEGPPQPTRGPGERRKLPSSPGRKRVLEYLELEKAHVIATNLSFDISAAHI